MEINQTIKQPKLKEDVNASKLRACQDLLGRNLQYFCLYQMSGMTKLLTGQYLLKKMKDVVCAKAVPE